MKDLQPWHRNPEIEADCGHVIRADNARYCDVQDNVMCSACADEEWAEGHVHVNYGESIRDEWGNRK